MKIVEDVTDARAQAMAAPKAKAAPTQAASAKAVSSVLDAKRASDLQRLRERAAARPAFKKLKREVTM